MGEAFAALERQALETWEGLESRPRVRVGTALCGLAAGAGQVLEALQREIERRGLDVAVHAVGCIGPVLRRAPGRHPEARRGAALLSQRDAGDGPAARGGLPGGRRRATGPDPRKPR